jgi:hypothetical protein
MFRENYSGTGVPDRWVNTPVVDLTGIDNTSAGLNDILVHDGTNFVVKTGHKIDLTSAGD